MEVRNLPEALDGDREFHEEMCRLSPSDALNALQFIQLPKRAVDENDPSKGVESRRFGRLIFRSNTGAPIDSQAVIPVSYTHLRAHETSAHL
eukprot:8543994-Alexandrium_andersonii.AAC.1